MGVSNKVPIVPTKALARLSPVAGLGILPRGSRKQLSEPLAPEPPARLPAGRQCPPKPMWLSPFCPRCGPHLRCGPHPRCALSPGRVTSFLPRTCGGTDAGRWWPGRQTCRAPQGVAGSGRAGGPRDRRACVPSALWVIADTQRASYAGRCWHLL